MKLSKKTRYGLRALVDLSICSRSEHVALYSIAERNHISPQYLEQVFASLRRAGIVKSIKGSQGGYFLASPSEQISVAEIVEALEGTYAFEQEEVPKDALNGGISATIQSLVIDQVNQKLAEFLNGLTLADLEHDYLERQKLEQDMYYI